MSEPKRYDCYILGGNSIDDSATPDGEFVRYEDYARLKAEVERLNAVTTRTIIPNEILQAQVERLTKVGNEMADYLFDAPYPCRIFYHKWIEAKEGKGQP